jgi:glycosyltransferase involved in cell wall biosynthesis
VNDASSAVCASRLRLAWPFLGIVDEAGCSNGWCALSGPLRRQSDLEAYRELRRRFRFVGVTSYTTFPSVEEGVVSDYEGLCSGWCHCFRDPDLYISPDTPRELISESDFVDYRRVAPFGVADGRAGGKDFDFTYVCLPGWWKETTKNWALAKRCLHRLCYDLDLRGLLLGRWQILDLPFQRNLTIKGDVPQEELLRDLSRSRLLFVPSILDASPRVIAEALCLDVPVLLHQDILGGWKYVNDATGAFFRSEDDVSEAAARCLEPDVHPRRWFQENYGPEASSSRLSAFLRQLAPDLPLAPKLRLSREIDVGGS